MRVTWRREPARLLFHLNGVSRIVLERWKGCGLLDGGGYGSIPTEAIPPRLRALGSRFVIVFPSIEREPGDSADELAAAAREVRIKVEDADADAAS